MADNYILQSEKAKFTFGGDEDEITVGEEAIGEAVYDVGTNEAPYGGKATDIRDYEDGYTGGENTGGGKEPVAPTEPKEEE